ncbi:hypothetical protein XCR1_1510003 [Xenorhabdus cabanillasii JM26]|uniref:Uncharacterized protein n=1 Tax=Xenorhabdus cabanillasii JM26 TaxID=1427517 RepID=W1IT91_9GAMM|nr:hypothetical protein XCR1_1510003 [Xenorhabdus cabanillasii JM26]
MNCLDHRRFTGLNQLGLAIGNYFSRGNSHDLDFADVGPEQC